MPEEKKPIEEQESKLAKKLEQKEKFTEEELEKIKTFQARYVECQVGFGQISIARLQLEKQIEDVKEMNEVARKKFIELQLEEQKFIKKITEKYGPGTLNPQTGEFSKITDKQ